MVESMPHVNLADQEPATIAILAWLRDHNPTGARPTQAHETCLRSPRPLFTSETVMQQKTFLTDDRAAPMVGQVYDGVSSVQHLWQFKLACKSIKNHLLSVGRSFRNQAHVGWGMGSTFIGIQTGHKTDLACVKHSLNLRGKPGATKASGGGAGCFNPKILHPMSPGILSSRILEDLKTLLENFWHQL